MKDFQKQYLKNKLPETSVASSFVGEAAGGRKGQPSSEVKADLHTWRFSGAKRTMFLGGTRQQSGSQDALSMEKR